eukprot:scaffold26780_cov147-Cylindrotheca_fusiformis.AAC.1
MSGSSSRDRPRVATFSFSDSLLGDASLDPPPVDLTSPAGASLASFSTAQSGGESSNRFFSDLSIPSSQLTKAAIEHLLTVQKTTQEWEEFMNEFRVLAQDQFPVEKFHLEELLRKVGSHRTETTNTERDDSRPPSATSGNSSAFSFEEVEAFEKPSATDVAERLTSVEDYLVSSGNLITKELTEVSDRVNQTHTSLTEVVKSLGTCDATGQLMGPAQQTVWDSLSDLKRELHDQKQAQAALKHEVEVEIPADFTTLATAEEGNWRNLANQLQAMRAQDAAVIQSLTSRVQALEQGQTTQSQSAPVPMYRRQRNVFTNPTFPWSGSTNTAPNQVTAPATAANSTVSQSLSDLRIEMDDLKASFVSMRAQITNLEGRLNQDSTDMERIKFGGLGFENLDDAELFVVDQRKNGSEQVGFLVDIYLLCNMIFRHVGGDYDFLKTSETINKLDLKSNRSAQALVAFQAPIPELFSDPTKSGDVWTQTAKDRSCFSRFKTLTEWNSGQLMIREKLGRVVTGTQEQLNA